MEPTTQRPVRRALLSVSDKADIVEFAQALAKHDIEILSTGGTAKLLTDNGLSVTEVADHTGFPEIMAGRVKTLHPKIHGGLLGRRGTDDAVMAEQGIDAIDLLVVNLYPFAATVAREDCTLSMAIENIDIGGPAMLRSAAKNHAAVTVVVDSRDYPRIIEELDSGGISATTRFELAGKAFAHTAHYDATIANYLGGIDANGNTIHVFANTYSLQMQRLSVLRYGENPHQRAALYRDPNATEPGVANARLLAGKALSYNNVADSDAALECVKGFDTCACVIVKHANPCGVALADSPLEAYQRAYRTDPTSAFGGILAFNRDVDGATARAIVDQQFAEVIIAPHIDEAAQAVLAEKPNIRLLTTGALGKPVPAFDFKRITGGWLAQDRDLAQVDANELRIVTRRQPDTRQIADLIFAWQVAKFVKSNAIVYARDRATIGIGAGQMSRVYSARIAAIKAADEHLQVSGSVMASDAFFPFRDGLDAAAEAGIAAVIQPGGSMRDDEVIAAADEHNIAMVFTGIRHFRH